MQHMLLVGFGGAIGAMARYMVTVTTLRLFGPMFPWGTLCVNIFGSLLMGILAALFLAKAPDALSARLFVLTGVLGGFTTFSAFSLDVVELAERGAWGLVTAYVIGSVVVSIAACLAGVALVRAAMT